jgi:polygalacturonase
MGYGLHLGSVGTPFVPDKEVPFEITEFSAKEDGEFIILKGDVPDFYKVGRILAIEHERRVLSSVFLIDSKEILIENFRIITGLGMGIFCYRTENVTLDGVKLTHDEKSPCIIANSADVVHSFGNSGKFDIKNCVFEGMIDDAINIHSNFRTVKSVCGNEMYVNLASCELQAKNLYKTRRL